MPPPRIAVFTNVVGEGWPGSLLGGSQAASNVKKWFGEVDPPAASSIWYHPIPMTRVTATVLSLLMFEEGGRRREVANRCATAGALIAVCDGGPRARSGLRDLMRILACGLALAASVFCAAGCSQTSASSGPKLIIYSDFDAEFTAPLIAKFEAADPGNQVELIPLDSRTALERIRSEAAEGTQAVASVWWGSSDVMLTIAARENLLDPANAAWARTLQPQFRDDQQHWIGQFIEPFCIAFRHGHKDPPVKLQDLAGPTYRGALTFPTPTLGSPAANLLGGLLWLAGARTNPSAVPMDWVAMFDVNRVGDFAASDRECIDRLLENGSLDRVIPDFAIVTTSEAVQSRDLRGEALDFIIPTDTLGFVRGVAKLKKGPEPALASRFIEYIGRDEHLSYYLQKGRIPLPLERMEASAVPEWASLGADRARIPDREVLASELENWILAHERRSQAGAPAMIPLSDNNSLSMWILEFAGAILVLIVLLMLIRRGGLATDSGPRT